MSKLKRSDLSESDGSGTDASSSDDDPEAIIHSISKYKTPGADRVKYPQGEGGEALSKDDKEAVLFGERTRQRTEKEKAVFMKKYKEIKPEKTIFETFQEQVERRVAWMVTMFALKRCEGTAKAITKGDVYSLIQWVVLNFNIVSYSKDEQLLKKVMDTRIKHSQTFTDYLAVCTHDFESIKNTKIGASFGDDYFKHLIVTGVKGDIRFQGELEQLEREGDNMARIVMRLAKVEKGERKQIGA
jgi:hypothetical protein